jgi:hypothetical protein
MATIAGGLIAGLGGMIVGWLVGLSMTLGLWLLSWIGRNRPEPPTGRSETGQFIAVSATGSSLEGW